MLSKVTKLPLQYKSSCIFTTGMHIVLDVNKNLQVCFPDCIPAKNTFSKLVTKAPAKDVKGNAQFIQNTTSGL